MHTPTPGDEVTLDTDLSATFGLGELSEVERDDFLASVGDVLLESALISFVSSLPEDARAEFEQFLANAPEGEAFLMTLGDTYPKFLEFLEAEMRSFRGEAVAVLGDDAATA